MINLPLELDWYSVPATVRVPRQLRMKLKKKLLFGDSIIRVNYSKKKLWSGCIIRWCFTLHLIQTTSDYLSLLNNYILVGIELTFDISCRYASVKVKSKCIEWRKKSTSNKSQTTQSILMKFLCGQYENTSFWIEEESDKSVHEWRSSEVTNELKKTNWEPPPSFEVRWKIKDFFPIPIRQQLIKE